MSSLSLVEDHDDDVTLLKSHFDHGGPELPAQVQEPDVECTVSIPTVEGLSEHVTQLFPDTFQQVDFQSRTTHCRRRHRNSYPVSLCRIVR